MNCQRLYNKLVAELRIEARNPGSWCDTTPAFSQRGHSGTKLDLDVARGHSALVRLHSGIFLQLKCKSLVLEPTKQFQLLLEHYTPSVSASFLMPGMLQEFAFCSLKRKKNEKDDYVSVCERTGGRERRLKALPLYSLTF